jgi:aquaporin Z
MFGPREYAAEFFGTALLMLIGLSGVILIFSTHSPLFSPLSDDRLRRLLVGVVFGTTLALLIYSPLGRRSGGHLNPAVSLAFWRLGKMRAADAGFYVAAQVGGALAGTAVVALVWRGWADSVRLGATAPRDASTGSALLALGLEFVMVFLLATLVFNCIDRPSLMPYTGVFVGLTIVVFVFFVAPVSGTSLNPARTLGPAVVGSHYLALWLYLLGPPLGALAAAFVFADRHAKVACGKLFHPFGKRCQFIDCQYMPPEERIPPPVHRRRRATQ